MYNGIGLTTPRGSGTNGHVQRNWAFVRPGKKDKDYRAEDDTKKLDAQLNRPPNKEILDHDRKRKIEVKCIEFEEILEKQGRTPEEIKSQVDSYRQKLMGQGKTDIAKDEFGRVAVRETHQIAEAQQQKNAKLREAFNISEYFVEGSSFDCDRKAKEDLAKTVALQKELDAQRESLAAAAAAASTGAAAAAAAGKDKETGKRYALLRTPSRERDDGAGKSDAAAASGDERDHVSRSDKKKKKKRARESSSSPERRKDKKKKSKKHKKERDSYEKESKKKRKVMYK
ncbi:serine/arginine repetitive matrix protein 2 isoform X9 [Drosophila navojoa]|uniref:serine/arginine repetitive matrix protein 2 isoform X9 n=2 Tax=Drosophila navojoa TaxID=7232 RepID=UPI0011BF78BE|nr:serine/arginine repetitive matrix protein 2 isoform X9 [Drosophila navojoa]